MKADMIIRSNCIITCGECGDTGIIDGFVAVAGGRIIAVEQGGSFEEIFEASDEGAGHEPRLIDARGKTVIPGLIDPHTHLVHGGSRERELSMKLSGVPYLEILKGGGGILSTVKSTRNSTREGLRQKAAESLRVMLLHGTTTIEAKSGYGLDFDTEVRCLEAAAELNEEQPVDIVGTYMGAHAVSPEFKGDTACYMRLMVEKVMPYVDEKKLAEFMDVFCEEGVFSPEESKYHMNEGRKLGFKLKIHA
ncbi:MAG: amidohydrolase family protein, partial [Clostridiales bacterium]|nr:amidohydrolase family protein [Clostridiales bacterium]